MIEFNESGIDMVRTYVEKTATKHGFGNEAKQFLRGIPLDRLNVRANMFLCIGMNSSGQTVSMNNVFRFIQKGCNRFFLSIKNRWELSEDMFKTNLYKGKYNLACDYYVARAVFDAAIIGDDIIDEWNLMISSIIIKGRHGIKVERVMPNIAGLSSNEVNLSYDEVKYRWIDRCVNTSRKKKKTK